jgi:DNA-binding transcriptional MerR regulator
LDKAPEAFRTISEVADDLDLPQHVLRFWESRFPQIKPMKRGGGRRYYRPDDVALLRGIRHLLYGQGYTIRGVQRILRERGIRFVQLVWEEGARQPDRREHEGEEDMPTAEMEGREDGRPGGLFGLLRTKEADDNLDEPEVAGRAERREPTLAPPPPRASVRPHVEAPFSGDERLRLQGVLAELAECRRLLDAALVDQEA